MLEGGKGWLNSNSLSLSSALVPLLDSRLTQEQKERSYLSLSAVGGNCQRKLWYRINQPNSTEGVTSSDKLKFLYGDLLEAFILEAAKAAGHTVVGQQDELKVGQVKGHRDAVIDGMLIDVKTASPFSFKKFKMGGLIEDDPFGYIAQLSSYLHASQKDPLVTNKTHAAFLVVNKVTGEILLDIHDLSHMLKDIEARVQGVVEMVAGSIPSVRLAPVPQYKTGDNKKLCMSCSFCEYKKTCWPEMRTFQYSGGYEYLVEVHKEPRATEVTEGQVSW